MGERKTWTPEEDQILRQLYEEKGIKKWSLISQLMEREYHIKDRNGKQCRERYNNHLKSGISKQRWSREEEELLVELHSRHGNRWALISKLISGRTENCVKNMFNSKLRKSVRLLNRFVYLHYRKLLKQIKINFANRLFEFTEAAHKTPEELRSPQERTAINLKNAILRQDFYQVHEVTQEQKSQIRTLIEQIHSFKRQNYKYYRGNVLARLRKQKLKHRATQEDCGGDQALSSKRSSQYQLLGGCGQKGESRTDANIVQFQDLLSFIKQQPESAPVKEQPGYIRPAQLANNDTLERKSSVCRLQSLQNNYCNLEVNDGQERPIPTENYMRDMTTPRYENDILDWSCLSLF